MGEDGEMGDVFVHGGACLERLALFFWCCNLLCRLRGDRSFEAGLRGGRGMGGSLAWWAREREKLNQDWLCV